MEALSDALCQLGQWQGICLPTSLSGEWMCSSGCSYAEVIERRFKVPFGKLIRRIPSAQRENPHFRGLR